MIFISERTKVNRKFAELRKYDPKAADKMQRDLSDKFKELADDLNRDLKLIRARLPKNPTPKERKAIENLVQARRARGDKESASTCIIAGRAVDRAITARLN